MDETGADLKCKEVADAVHLPGIYRALVYAGNRNPLTPNAVLPAGKRFYNCVKETGGVPDINGVPAYELIANNVNDFLNADADGNYLPHPIVGDEKGDSQTGVKVWTNFNPSNGALNNGGGKICRTWFITWAEQATVWYGTVGDRKISWSYTSKQYSTNSESGATNNCLADQKAFYCVHQ